MVNPRILLAPLDWGLGHATRCIPLIRHLVSSGCEVIVAAEGKQQELLQLEFPSIRMVYLKGYRLKYSNNRWKTIVKIVSQIPQIIAAARSEHLWLNRFCEDERIDAIISDNRYGFFLRRVLSVIMTHQLTIKTPFGMIGDRLLRSLNYRALRNFDACWVPDNGNDDNLGGELSHPAQLPRLPLFYIGPLSRFENFQRTDGGLSVLVLLSGPEPQRSIFESIVLSQMSAVAENIIILRGLPGESSSLHKQKNNFRIYNHLPAGQMMDILSRAGIIISRPGYSTVMEMLLAGKKCIFVPTPGQTEQEYLAAYLSKRNLCVSAFQHSFSMPELIAQIQQRTLARFNGVAGPDRRVMDSFISQLITSPSKTSA